MQITIKIIAVFMMLNGIFFMSNIYVLGDHEAAIAMHDDLSPEAGPVMVQAKVLNCFVVGILYLLSGIGLLRANSHLASLGALGCLVFLALYGVELIMWGDTHTRVWIDFSIFGGVSFIFGMVSFLYWKGIFLQSKAN